MTTEHTCLLADNQFITQVGLRWLIRQTYTDALICEVADKRTLLAVLSEGKTSVVILDYTLCDFRTIITHKKNLFRKLEVNNIYEATKYALKAGLIELVEYYI